MNIRMRAFAQFGELFGAETSLEVSENSTIPETLHRFCDGSEEKRQALFDENGAIHPYIILVRNRVRVERDELEVLRLGEGDELALLPPVAGG
jgi:molybdopterin converting factor small subunit